MGKFRVRRRAAKRVVKSIVRITILRLKTIRRKMKDSNKPAPKKLIKRLKMKVTWAKKRVVKMTMRIRRAKVARKAVRRIKRSVTKVCIKAAKSSCPCSLVRSLKRKAAAAKKSYLEMRAKLIKRVVKRVVKKPTTRVVRRVVKRVVKRPRALKTAVPQVAVKPVVKA